MVQLPAMNTTQFGWVLSKLPKKPRPMGKVYQPEVAARAILFAAAHPRREVWVGFPTYEAIIGNKIAPWYADWVLSRTGFEGQQTNEKASPDRKDNVWEPVHEDRGAYGEFKNIATNNSFTLWAGMHRATFHSRWCGDDLSGSISGGKERLIRHDQGKLFTKTLFLHFVNINKRDVLFI